MKKTIAALALALICCMAVPFSSQAKSKNKEKEAPKQSRYTVSMDFHGATGLGVDTKAIAGLNALIMIHNTDERLLFGVGTGVDYLYGMYEERADQTIDNQCEISVPVYLRAKFVFSKRLVSPYVQMDAGYRIGAFSYDRERDKGERFGKCLHSGIFLEPQVGLRFGGRTSVGAGVSLQRFTKYYYEDEALTTKLGWSPVLLLHCTIDL